MELIWSLSLQTDRWTEDSATQIELPGFPTEKTPEVLCSHAPFAGGGGGRELTLGSQPCDGDGCQQLQHAMGQGDTAIFGPWLAWGKRAEHLLFPG